MRIKGYDDVWRYLSLNGQFLKEMTGWAEVRGIALQHLCKRMLGRLNSDVYKLGAFPLRTKIPLQVKLEEG